MLVRYLSRPGPLLNCLRITAGTTEASGAVHQELLAIEEEIFTELGIPYRVLDICSGDLGGPAYRKFDLEAWMPGRGESGEYGEVTSASDCTDYQSRRLNIRYRPTGQKGTRFVYTLNGTAVALSRALIGAIILVGIWKLVTYGFARRRYRAAL